MQFVIIAALVAITLCSHYIEAYPQQYYRPRPTMRPYNPNPRPIRVRRQVLSGQMASNPNGGADARLDLTKAIGTPEHNLIGNVFAAGNTAKGPATTGGTVAYNNNGFGAALTKTHTPGGIDTFKQSASANLFKNDVHSIDANVFASQNKLANGFKFERNGAGLDYSHASGHGASLTHSNIPNFGKQLELAGKANLWSSQDRNTRLDLAGTASQWTSGPLSGQRDFGGNVGLTHFFG